MLVHDCKVAVRSPHSGFINSLLCTMELLKELAGKKEEIQCFDLKSFEYYLL